MPGEKPFWLEVRLYGAIAVFGFMGGIIYGVWSGEATGTVLFLLTGALFAIVAGYLAFQDRLARTEARSIEEGEEAVAGLEDNLFLPHASVRPLEVGAGMTLTLAGFALGWAVLVPGFLLLVHGLWGWAVQSRYRDPR
jgi:hypothetical protein